MTANNRLLTLAAAVVTVVLAAPAGATLSRAISFDKKVDEAQTIVVGKCIGNRSQWDSQHQFILTYSTFRVEQTLKGNAPAEVTVVTPGGRVGSLRQESVGIPQFREGDERLLFVKNTPAGPTVLYFDQGTYNVKSDEHGEKIVEPVPSAAVRIDTQTGKAVEPESARSLREMQRDIREASTRVEAQKMELVRARRNQQSAAETPLSRYKFLLIAAVIGAMLATWQLLRR